MINDLIDKPQDFSFTQAVRLLERSALSEKADNTGSTPTNNNANSAQLNHSSKEAIRFIGNNSFSFPDSDILLIKNASDDTESPSWDITVNFMGLCGSMGVLPYHYGETLLKRAKEKDESLKYFLDLFNHRIVSLFYKASTKYNLAINYETAHLQAAKSNQPDNKDSITHALLSLIGLGEASLRNRQNINDESLIAYSGLLTQQVRSSSGLKDMLTSYFSVPIKINEFIGQWQDLIDDVRTKLPSFEQKQGQNAVLGRNCMLGKKGWYAQGKIQVVLGPLDRDQYARFEPKSNGLQAINDMVRFYIGMEQDVDYLIQIKQEDTPSQIKFNKNNPPIMGWSSWLGQNKNNSTEDIMEVKISSRCINNK